MAQFLLTALSHMLHHLYGAKNIQETLLDDDTQKNNKHFDAKMTVAQDTLKHIQQLLLKQNQSTTPQVDYDNELDISFDINHQFKKTIQGTKDDMSIRHQNSLKDTSTINENELDKPSPITQGEFDHNPTNSETIDKLKAILSEIKDLIAKIHNDNNKYSNDEEYRTNIFNYLIEREQQLEALYQISLEYLEHLGQNYDSMRDYSENVLLNYFEASKDQLFMISKNIDNKELVDTIIVNKKDKNTYYKDYLYKMANEKDNTKYIIYVHKILRENNTTYNISTFHINISKIDIENIIYVLSEISQAIENNIYQNLNKHVTSTKITSEYPLELMYKLMDKYNPKRLNNIAIINKLKAILSEIKKEIKDIIANIHHHKNNVDQDNEIYRTNILNYLIERNQQLEILYQISLKYLKQYYENHDSISYFSENVLFKYFKAAKDQLFMISKNIKNKELVDSIIVNENISKINDNNIMDVLPLITKGIENNIYQNLNNLNKDVISTKISITYLWGEMYMLMLKYNPNEDKKKERVRKIDNQVIHNENKINVLSNKLSKLALLKKDIVDNFRKFENLPKPIFESSLDKNKINNNRNKSNDYIKATLILFLSITRDKIDPIISVTKDFTINKYIIQITTPESIETMQLDKYEAENYLMELVTKFSTEYENEKKQLQEHNKYLRFLWNLNKNVKYEDPNIYGDKYLKQEKDNNSYFYSLFAKYIYS